MNLPRTWCRGLPVLVFVVLSVDPIYAAQPVQNEVETVSDAVMLLWWDGLVRIGSHSGTSGQELVLPASVRSGDVVHVDSASRCFVLDTARGLLLFETRGAYRYNEGVWSGPEPTRIVTLAGADAVASPEVPWTVQAGGTKKLFSDEHAVLIEPVETGVNTLSPALKWAPPSRGEPVAVNLWRLESDGGLKLLESWRDVRGPVHRPWTELDRGRTYLWRIRPEGGLAGDEIPERLAWFHVLSVRANTFLDSSLAALVQFTEDPTARLGIRASLLTLVGLLAEAELAWRSLGLARPDRSVARRSAGELSRRRLDGPRSLAMPPLPFGLVRPPTDLPEVSPP